jgi:acyl-coenzyme A thioesterase PaaI-like protein
MLYSPKSLKWLLRIYPPFLFQRIWVKKIHTDFQGVDVKIIKSIFNKNSNNTIFGGTIFSAVDPFYAILIDQRLQSHGFKKTVAWLKSASIEYKKPGLTNLKFSIKITDEDFNECMDTLNSRGRIIKTFSVEIVNDQNEICAIAKNEIYIRDLNFTYSRV